ncbi:hypothetical protein [Pseudoxanthomonas winnipegensis]|jgi:hypothetical protein|nr:hypothetical protein [Pseudoxanthomonas winnipegensis]
MDTESKASRSEAENTDVIILGVASTDTKGPGGVIEFMGRTTVPGISAD